MNKIRFAWIVSLIATMGSLYFSEIRNFVPCELCWYQRILMYPLVIILGIAVFKNNKNIYQYVLPMTIIGMCVSTFHYLKQKIKVVGEIGTCNSGVPCNAAYINWSGFITIPFLALIAFSIITILLFLVRKEQKRA